MLDRLEEHRKNTSSQVLRAMEEERKRIARELHDETSQALTTLIIHQEMTLELMKSKLQRGSLPADSVNEVADHIKESRSITMKTLEEIRRLTFELRPTILDDLGLVAAVRWLAKNAAEPAGIKTKLNAYGLEDRLPEDVETVVFRIIQEACTNAVRHANAKNIKVHMDRRGDDLVVVVEDDGEGFLVRDVLSSRLSNRGLGLFGMEERASLVGGEVSINSLPGKGTKVWVRVPLKRGEGEVR
jgi:two-component system sensor histidine kinase UhpB